MADFASLPWLLWGDPAGYTSPPGARREALAEAITRLEQVVMNGTGTEEIAETLIELRATLATPDYSSGQ